MVRLLYLWARSLFPRPSRYREDNMTPLRFAAAAAGALLVALLGSPSVADVISDWSKAVVPPPPELKEVTVDPSTTALLFLDIMKGELQRASSLRRRCAEHEAAAR